MKTDYYLVLEVEETATFVELKKAYRKKALLLHPDKNPDDIENTTRLFNEVRVAYETLSDPQERSWYDSHKFQILMEDGDSNNDYNGNDDSFDVYYAGTSCEDIERYMNINLYQSFNDSVNGFYSIVSVLLDKIASEEVTAGKQQKLPGFLDYKDDTSFATVCDPKELLYPRMGNSRTDFDTTRMFYKVWSNFQSVKTFNWCDEYRYSIAPDRRTRRIMEKENKKLRESARKRYNEITRKFIAFIKKLDPRMDPKIKEKHEKENLARQREEMRIQAQLEKVERQRQRKLFKEQDWQAVDPDELAEIEAQLEKLYQEEKKINGEESEEDEFENNLFECIICDKTFKSEKQFSEHEKSKKHLKLLKQLQWEMRKEGIELGIDGEGFVQEDSDGTLDDNFEEFADALEDIDKDEAHVDKFDSFSGKEDLQDFDDLDNLDNLDHLTNEELEVLIAQQIIEEEQTQEIADYIDGAIENTVSLDAEVVEIDDDIDDDIYDEYQTQSKGRFKGDKTSDKLEELSKLLNGSHLKDDSDDDWDIKPKGKSKKVKKARNQEFSPSSAPANAKVNVKLQTCSVCKETFTSRNKLFQHVETTGHAAPQSKVKKSKRKEKKSILEL